MKTPSVETLQKYLESRLRVPVVYDCSTDNFFTREFCERNYSREVAEIWYFDAMARMNATEKKPKEPVSEQTVTVTNPRPCWTFKMPEATQAKHFDEGKTRFDLIPVSPLFDIANAFEHGSRKYGEGNWQKGMPWSKLYASACRHILRWKEGVTLDEESGYPSLAHAVADLMMLLKYANTHPELDDREKNP